MTQNANVKLITNNFLKVILLILSFGVKILADYFRNYNNFLTDYTIFLHLLSNGMIF